MTKKAAILVLLILSTVYCSAQFVSFGQDRASLRWKQIKTDRFQIIYPDFFEKNAQKAANLFTRLYDHANTLQVNPRKISVILHADGGISNGNVALAPRKSELYTMPSQDPGDDWLQHLCVHEFRHVVQFDKTTQGLTRGLYYLFGELFPIAVIGIYLPMWFIEGDAVCFETSVGHIGRGRSPEFLNEMKAQIVEKGLYNYHKVVLGSHKDHVPGRYPMGYFITANTRLHYGPELWGKAVERSGRRPFGITPFNKGLALSIGSKRDSLWNTPSFRALFTDPDSLKKANTYRNTKRTLYQDNLHELRQIWLREIAGQTNTFDTISTRNKYFTHYYAPIPLPDHSLLAYKKGIQETGAFVLLRSGKEKMLTRTGITDDCRFATDNRLVVWSEYRPHLRWQQGGRMRLSSYDLRTGRYRSRRGANNQFAPFRTSDGWGYVETDRCNRSFIVLADTTLRHERWRIEAAEGEHFIHPAYHDGHITTVVQSPQGLRLESIDIATRRRTPLTHNLHYELDNPSYIGDTLIYRASYNGNNAFYRLTRDSSELLLDSRYGIRFPFYHADSDSLYFSFYTSDGYKPGVAARTDLTPRPADYRTYPLADSITRQEQWNAPLTCDTLYPTRRYRRFPHLFNIHSWAPVYANLSPMEFDFGATVYSQNKLSTLSFTAGFVRQSGRSHGNWLLDATYSGLWPVISIHFESGRENYTDLANAYHHPTGTLIPLYLSRKARRSSADLTLQFPLNLSTKQYNRSLAPYLRYKVEGIHSTHVRNAYAILRTNPLTQLLPVIPGEFTIPHPKRHYQLMEYGITYNNQTRLTTQEINPRWGQRLSAGYTHTLRRGLDLGSQWWTSAQLYFPGILVNHSIAFYGGFQHITCKARTYGNKIAYPRGITLDGYQITTFRSAYHFPLLFPDWHIGPVLYFKQVNACAFYDHGINRTRQARTHYSSCGIELTADTHLFRLTYPILFGIRTGYQTQTSRPFAEFLFSVGLSI